MIEHLPFRDLPTPLLVYSETALGEAWSRIQNARPQRIFLALKSCYRLPVLEALRRLGAGAEVMSPLEYRLARRAGFAPSSILVNGLGRTREFLDRVATDECIVIADTLEEFDYLQGVVPARRLGVRLRPQLPSGESYAQPSKLGLPTKQLPPDLDRKAHILHLHLTSQQTTAELFLHVLRHLPWSGFKVLDLGGGWETAQDVEVHQFQRVGEAFRELFPGRELWLEPGRALVNGAGIVVTTVQAVKESEGRTYAVVDAPTSTLMPHQEATYRLLHPRGEPRHSVDLVDGITSLTSTIRTVQVEKVPQPGDRLLLGNCGAYTSAMSRFWAFPPIPTAFLDAKGNLHPDLTLEKLRRAEEALLY